jgi:hypothetical protein
MTEKEKQHLVSKTFLKHFVIPNSKNQVWCIELNGFEKNKPIIKGTKQRIFTIKNFYSLSDKNNRLLLENFYSDKLEPIYNDIIKEVTQEISLSEIIRIKLIEWIMHSNIKTEYFRNNIERLSQFLIHMYSNYGVQKESFGVRTKDNYSKEIAKEIQLETVLNPGDLKDIFNLFYNELTTKKWSILKSNKANPFIANDNPGFSLNTSGFGKNTFNKTIQLSRISFNYFVLSPKYCLFIEPFKQDDDISLNALNMKINYAKIKDEVINLINEGTTKTALRYIISNDFDTISRWNIN